MILTEETKEFLETFSATDLQKDQLPIKVFKGRISKREAVGQSMQWTFEYLYNRLCPWNLIECAMKIASKDVLAQFRSGNVASLIDFDIVDGNIATNEEMEGSSLEPLQLMHSVVKAVDEFCVKLKDIKSDEEFKARYPDFCHNKGQFQVSFYSMKNSRRAMEDKFVSLPSMQNVFEIDKELSYFAVFDGHNGVEAACYGAAQLHQFFIENVQHDIEIGDSLSLAFQKTDSTFIKNNEHNTKTSGSTATVVVIDKDTIYVAWVGDCLASLHFGNGRIKQLVTGHKPDQESEANRIKEMGGEVFELGGVFRVNGTLAVSRSIGDPDFKKFVVSDPEVLEIQRSDLKEEYIVLGSDGLWDVMTPTDIGKYVNELIVQNKATEAAQMLSNEAKSRGSSDNITVIIVYLQDIEKLALSIQERTSQDVSIYEGSIGKHHDTFSMEAFHLKMVDERLVQNGGNNGGMSELICLSEDDPEIKAKGPSSLLLVETKVDQIEQDSSDEEEWSFSKGGGQIDTDTSKYDTPPSHLTAFQSDEDTVLVHEDNKESLFRDLCLENDTTISTAINQSIGESVGYNTAQEVLLETVDRTTQHSMPATLDKSTQQCIPENADILGLDLEEVSAVVESSNLLNENNENIHGEIPHLQDIAATNPEDCVTVNSSDPHSPLQIDATPVVEIPLDSAIINSDVLAVSSTKETVVTAKTVTASKTAISKGTKAAINLKQKPATTTTTNVPRTSPNRPAPAGKVPAVAPRSPAKVTSISKTGTAAKTAITNSTTGAGSTAALRPPISRPPATRHIPARSLAKFTPSIPVSTATRPVKTTSTIPSAKTVTDSTSTVPTKRSNVAASTSTVTIRRPRAATATSTISSKATNGLQNSRPATTTSTTVTKASTTTVPPHRPAITRSTASATTTTARPKAATAPAPTATRTTAIASKRTPTVVPSKPSTTGPSALNLSPKKVNGVPNARPTNRTKTAATSKSGPVPPHKTKIATATTVKTTPTAVPDAVPDTIAEVDKVNGTNGPTIE